MNIVIYSYSNNMLYLRFQVRGLWAETDGVLSTLGGDGKAVESVIRGQVDQYTLDGQDLGVRIPTVLRERLERLSHQVRVTEKAEDI